jgi:hypothetical protein
VSDVGTRELRSKGADKVRCTNSEEGWAKAGALG